MIGLPFYSTYKDCPRKSNLCCFLCLIILSPLYNDLNCSIRLKLQLFFSAAVNSTLWAHDYWECLCSSFYENVPLVVQLKVCAFVFGCSVQFLHNMKHYISKTIIMITENDSFTTLLLLALRPNPSHGTQPLLQRHIQSRVSRTWRPVFFCPTLHP